MAPLGADKSVMAPKSARPGTGDAIAVGNILLAVAIVLRYFRLVEVSVVFREESWDYLMPGHFEPCPI